MQPAQQTAASQPDAGAAQVRKRSGAAGTSAVLTMLLLGATLLVGWSFRHSGFVTAESGLGYALGILGSTMMVIMLIYPLRKRIKALRVLGSVKHWFRAHMMLGVLGPTLIILHTNFDLGSTNSRVALFCMVIVALSGFAGRYFYRQIHHGLYGQRASLRDLQSQGESLRADAPQVNELLPNIGQVLSEFENTLDQPVDSLMVNVLRPFTVNVRTRNMQRRLLREVRHTLRERARESSASAGQRRRLVRVTRRYLAQRLALSRRIAMFRFYERMFSLWHVFHIPIFGVMVVAVFVHIYAVHAY